MKNKISINCHSSIKITSEKIIYFDPYLIEQPSHDADLIFITHDHYDHFDLPSIKNIIKDTTKIVIPNSIARHVLASGLNHKNIIGVDPNEQYNIENIEVKTIPSYNTNKDFHPKKNSWVGYLLNLNDEVIYIAGDTDITSENQNLYCDIALIPIGGTYTMNKEEAAQLINSIKPKTVIPTHYGSIVGDYKDGQDFKKLLNENIECILLIGRTKHE